MPSDEVAETNPSSYESNLERLRQVVERLEKGSLSLEHSLELFEEGMKLSESCDKQLAFVEERVKVLVSSKERLDQDDNPGVLFTRKDLDIEIHDIEGEK